jgi:hypothetical protein
MHPWTPGRQKRTCALEQNQDADVSITWGTFNRLRALAPSMVIDPRFALDLWPAGRLAGAVFFLLFSIFFVVFSFFNHRVIARLLARSLASPIT